MNYQTLTAGPLRADYGHGHLRYVRAGDDEVLRMIYVALRDRDWRTVPIHRTAETVEQTADSFRVRYDWRTDAFGMAMRGHVAITGAADGTVTFEFTGEALVDFKKNRIGICVLHPLDGTVGQPAEVISATGERSTNHFPTYIQPDQPFRDIEQFRWQTRAGHPYRLIFAGDVFEMEDQRNWTDASFKIYSTPVDLPKPVRVAKGDTIWQRVILTFDDVATEWPPAHAQPRPEPTVSQRPRVGVGQRADGVPLTPGEANLLRPLDLSHLRADVFLTDADWQPRLTNALTDAKALNVPLELAVFFGSSPGGELDQLLAVDGLNPQTVGWVAVFDATTLTTSDALLRAVVPRLRAAWPNVLIGGGTDANFAEFNRDPFDYALVDFVTFPANPQVHAFDDLTLMENIEGQPHTVQTARYRSGNKPVHVSPITLLPRQITLDDAAQERKTPPADARQATPFAADWTSQSLRALTDAGAAHLTYYETHGPAGLLTGDTLYPVYTALHERLRD